MILKKICNNIHFHVRVSVRAITDGKTCYVATISPVENIHMIKNIYAK